LNPNMSYQNFLQKLAESSLRDLLAPGIYDQIVEGFAKANPIQIRQASRLLDRYLLSENSERQKFLLKLNQLSQNLENKIAEAEHQAPLHKIHQLENTQTQADQQQLNQLNKQLK
jgi:hypothetical protein